MKKNETKQLLNLIKGYYNSQFFVDDFVILAWEKELEPYDLEDAEERLKSYLKEYPDTPPKPHIFIKPMLTHEQKNRHEDCIVECNLCNRYMPISEYNSHYGRCLDIEYLVSIAKQKGEKYGREDLEQCKQDIIDRLIQKYEPKEIWKPKGVNNVWS